jgi:hypothetical protein
VGHFALLDPDLNSEFGSGSTDPIEFGSNSDPDPDPKPCLFLGFTSSTKQDYGSGFDPHPHPDSLRILV